MKKLGVALCIIGVVFAFMAPIGATNGDDGGEHDCIKHPDHCLTTTTVASTTTEATTSTTGEASTVPTTVQTTTTFVADDTTTTASTTTSQPAVTTTSTANDKIHKVWVCKYVGEPGDFETLKEGKNPITVDSDATIGTDFKDGQFHSFVIDVQTDANTGDGNTYIGEAQCPTPPPTTTTEVVTTTTVGAPTTTVVLPTTTTTASSASTTTLVVPTTTTPKSSTTKSSAPSSSSTTPSRSNCVEDEPCWNCATMGNHICGKPLPHTGTATLPLIMLALLFIGVGLASIFGAAAKRSA